MKAYRDTNGKVTMFRPDMNMKRMNNSAQRIALPVRGVILIFISFTSHNHACRHLMVKPCSSSSRSSYGLTRNGSRKSLDTASTSDRHSVRPLSFLLVIYNVSFSEVGTQPVLGVHPPTQALLFVIASPVGPYYPQGFKPVALYGTPDTEYIRAAPGGTGAFKIGANYAPGVLPQKTAAKKGYVQNLWLHGPDHLLTEVHD
jgi:branched-chain amino acid aminotransferase